jgi:hypothetical protein
MNVDRDDCALFGGPDVDEDVAATADRRHQQWQDLLEGLGPMLLSLFFAIWTYSRRGKMASFIISNVVIIFLCKIAAF